VKRHHLVEGKCSVGGVPSSGLKINRAQHDRFYCSRSSFETGRVQSSHELFLCRTHYLSLETVPAAA
jgi:hypothetical protein